MRIRNAFGEFFCFRSNLINDEIVGSAELRFSENTKIKQEKTGESPQLSESLEPAKLGQGPVSRKSR